MDLQKEWAMPAVLSPSIVEQMEPYVPNRH